MSDAVKERADASPCRECGGPTWSQTGYCFKCRAARPGDHAAGDAVAPPEPEDRVEHREPVLDDAGRLAEEIPCRGCGYLLQGLAPDRACPECSLPIRRSIHGDLLRYCDPRWLRRLAAGVLTIILGFAAWIVFGFGYGVLLVSFTAAGGAGSTAASVGVAAAGIGLTFVIVLGTWWLTAPDPGATESEPPITARKVARWLVGAQMIAAPLQLFGQTAAGASPMNPLAAVTPTAMIVVAAGMLLGTVAQAGYVAGLLYLGRLFRRMSRSRLAGQSRVVAWGYAVTQGFGLVYGILAVAIMPSFIAATTAGGPPPMAMLVLLGIGGCVVGVGTLVFGIWAVVLLIMARIAFVRVADVADAHWSGAA